MQYLSGEQVLFIHARLIKETGGEHGILDLGLLQSAVARPQATFDGRDLYPDLYTKSAALMVSLVNNHAFLDGNKRTAIASAGLFPQINGCRLAASNQELVDFTLACAQGQLMLEEIANWFENHVEETYDKN